MTTTAPDATASMSHVRTTARQGVVIILVGAALFFLALVALAPFRDFLAGSEDTGAKVGTVLLGVGLWRMASGLATAERGWRAVVAQCAGWSCLAGGVVTLVVELWPPTWAGADERAAEIGLTAATTVPLMASWTLLAAGFAALALVLVSDTRWPTWAGVVLLVFAILPFATRLPLFFQVGGIVAGLGVAASAARQARTTDRPGA
jgi:hypothetical protein